MKCCRALSPLNSSKIFFLRAEPCKKPLADYSRSHRKSRFLKIYLERIKILALYNVVDAFKISSGFDICSKFCAKGDMWKIHNGPLIDEPWWKMTFFSDTFINPRPLLLFKISGFCFSTNVLQYFQAKIHKGEPSLFFQLILHYGISVYKKNKFLVFSLPSSGRLFDMYAYCINILKLGRKEKKNAFDEIIFIGHK